MLALAVAGLVHAQVQTLPERRADGERSAQAALMGGVDSWTGGGGAALQLGASAWWDRRYAGVGMAGGYRGVAEWVPADGLVLDGHFAQLRVGGPRERVGAGASVSAGAFGQKPWLEWAVGGWTARRSRSGGWNLSASPLFRVGDHTPTPGMIGTGSWSTAVGTDRVGLRADARVFAGMGLPPAAVDATLWGGRVGKRGAVDASLGMGATAAAGDPVFLGGLAAPGATILRAAIQGTLSVAPGVGLRADLGYQRGIGSVEFSRVRVLVGLVAWDVRHNRPSAPAAGDAGVRFAVFAPRAAEVALLCSSNAWTPVPMSSVDDGWWQLAVPLDPGEYEYVYLLDGAPVTPPESVRRRADGFGGFNGVVVVAD